MLELARAAIKSFLKTGKPLKADPEKIDPALKNIGCVFVTLTINGQLRGCIGHLSATKALYKDIIENAAAAAFDDPRFEPLDPSELDLIRIEISVLSAPHNLEYKDASDLLKKLTPLKDGVILSKGYYKATYLPQVWEDLKDKEDFLSSLCMKAGLDPLAWKNDHLKVELYGAEKFGED